MVSPSERASHGLPDSILTGRRSLTGPDRSPAGHTFTQTDRRAHRGRRIVLSRIASALVLCLPAYFFSDTPAWALVTVSIAIVATIVGIGLVLGASRARTAQPA
jgi:hypothetical protein